MGMTIKKEKDFSGWFTQVVQKSKLADYSAVSGCMVIRELGYAIWENIKKISEERLYKLGIKPAYFPLLIPENLLKKEAAHVKGFSPEVAWVTHGGNTKLSERLAIRPTSEAIMYDSYSNWIRSWRDLPLKLCQWNNVIRWEFKHPVLLMRTREFLWTEGHTVFAAEKEAEKEIKDVMSIWKDVCENHLALYGLEGRKTEKEKFAGAVYTESLEYYLPNGKTAQGPDAHYDGQNFAKAYSIKFVDKDEKTKYPYQNTWAISTRMIGIMVAAHGDDKGLVLPPKIAPNKIVIIPIFTGKEKKNILSESKKINEILGEFNPVLDDREEYTPGWKFNEWELKGIPLRIEFGPRDLKAKQVVAVRRDTGEKKAIKLTQLKKAIPQILEAMQNNLFKKSKKLVLDNIVEVKNMNELVKAIKDKKIARVQFCNTTKCEDLIKDKTGGATTRGIIKNKSSSGKCIYCGKKAKVWVHIAKAY
ncbi:proline--tRNA ligase [Candidatus Woesearchaeota archaeon]|nr:proline--tRNA ligase [Candidatus Woesearchaeota archaeon]